MNQNYPNLFQNLISKIKKNKEVEAKKLIKQINNNNIDEFISVFINCVNDTPSSNKIHLELLKLIIKHHFWEVDIPPENLDKYIDDLKKHDLLFDLIIQFITGKKKILIMEKNIFQALDNIRTSKYMMSEFPILKVIQKKTQIMDFNIVLLEKIIPLTRSIFDSSLNTIPTKLDDCSITSQKIFTHQISERIGQCCQIFGHHFLQIYKILPITSLHSFNIDVSYPEKVKIYRHAGNRIIGILKSMSEYIEDYRNKRVELKKLLS